ncbi:MAG TPA: hypothetical protein VFS21_03345 [Roseiflexaceae bacterium]|nr:hypothetical protein [Roseiflexaceae bacterium]
MRGCWSCRAAVREQAHWCAACGAMLRWHAWRLNRQIGAGGNGTASMVERQGQLGVLKIPAAHVTPQEHQVECRNLYLAAALGVAPAPIETSTDGIGTSSPFSSVFLRSLAFSRSSWHSA